MKLKDYLGSGPLSFLLAFILALILLRIEIIFNIKKIISNNNLLAYVLLALGLLLMLYSVIVLPIKKRSKHLITHGPYKYVRHPIYSAGIFFLYPGAALLSRSWLMLFSTVLVYFIFKITVRYEEKYLLKVFGKEYGEYMADVNGFFPRLF